MTALAMILFVTTMPAFAQDSKSIKSDPYTISLGEGISLQMTVVTFNASKHKIKKCQILDWSGICLIDEKPVFGTDWELPINQLVKATVKIGSNTINLDVSCMYNPWIGKPDPQAFKIEKVEGGYLVRGSFSDGAGSYKAEWFIIQDRSVRTKLINEEC
jgi:hypothetical protein